MTALLERLQRNLGAIAGIDREHVRVGPFDAYVDHLRELKYHSFALPEIGASDADLGAALAPLRAAFAERGRTARTEFVEELFGGLEALLAADGWTLSERMPVMVCTRESLVAPAPVAGLVVQSLGAFTGEDAIRGFLEAQRESFADDSPISDEELARWRARAAASFHVAGMLDGRTVGTAHASRVLDGVTEIAGVATRPGFRRRGIAAVLTAAVAQAAFAGGAELAWLTAADDGAEELYARAGFRVEGTVLAYDAS